MKIAFVSDTHFGYSRFEKDATKQGEYAILDACKRCDVLLLGGDIFDQKIPSLETLTRVALLLQNAKKILNEKNIISPNILGIHGTHELRPKGLVNPIEMMCSLGLIENVHNRTVLLLGTDEKIAVSGIGGVPDDLFESILSKISCKPVDGALNFFLFHQTLSQFVPQAKNLASFEDLPLGYDYYLCGHIHARKEYMNSKLLIPGSTVLTQQKEEEQSQKGYLLFDTIAKTHEFVQIPTRPFEVYNLCFENATSSQVRLAIENELSKIFSKKYEVAPVIKLQLNGTLEKSSGLIDLSGFSAPNGAYLTIENRLEGSSLIDQLQKIKGEHFSQKPPNELGVELLRQNAKNGGLDPQKAIQFFEEFSTGLK